MKDMAEGVEGDDFIDRDVLKADGALAIEGSWRLQERVGLSS